MSKRVSSLEGSYLRYTSLNIIPNVVLSETDANEGSAGAIILV